jgi:hypothetical protein
MAEPKCPRCNRAVTPDDTLAFDGNRIVHLDCQRPRKLSPEERVLLFRYCFGHVVAQCVACGCSFRQSEFVTDLLAQRTHLCPHCRVDLIGSVRAHLDGCTMLPDIVRQRAREVRDASRELVKHSHQLVDRADVLMRQIEATRSGETVQTQRFSAALAGLRGAMRQITDVQFCPIREALFLDRRKGSSSWGDSRGGPRK